MQKWKATDADGSGKFVPTNEKGFGVLVCVKPHYVIFKLCKDRIMKLKSPAHNFRRTA